MAIVVRTADLCADRELMIALLSRHLGPHCDASRFDWLYRDNPVGPARVWIAVETSRKEPQGMAAAFPRQMYMGKSKEVGCVLGDFCLNAESRSLGPALQLQRACLAEIDSGKFRAAYDLPSTRMLAVYKRMGLEARAQSVRFAKLLRVDEKIGRLCGDGILKRVVISGANQVLAALNRRRTRFPGVELSKHEGLCGDEFSVLARTIGSRYGTCTVRSAEYLNWRYHQHPYRAYEMITARRRGELCGYGTFHHAEKHAVIPDLLGTDETVLEALVDEIVAQLKARPVSTVSCSLLISCWLAPMLRRSGFRAREASPVFLYESGHLGGEGGSVDSSRWFLLDGDRES